MKNFVSDKVPMEFCWKRQYSIFYASLAAYGWVDLLKEITGKDTIVRVEGFESWASIFSVDGFIEKLVQVIEKEIEKDYDAVTEYIKKTQATGNVWVNFAKKIKVNKKTPSEKLFSLHKKFFELGRPYLAELWRSFYFADAVGIMFENKLKQNLKENDIQKAILFYSKRSKKVFIDDILDYFKKENNLKKRADFIKKNFLWIFSQDPYSPPVTEKEIADYVSAKIENNTNNSINLNFPADIVKFAKVYQDALYLKDHRDEYRRKTYYYIQSLIEETIRRLNVGRDDLWYVRPDELKLLETDRDNFFGEIERRKKAYILEINNGEASLVSGSTAFQNFLNKKTDEKIDTIKGTIGAGGVQKGTVQLIKSRADVKNFREGKILVAVTTNPEYISAMQRAIAFVTDEGGITCHAAIIAREFKKPCVVGTKIATQVLKDGDLVEVDADKGIVKILK